MMRKEAVVRHTQTALEVGMRLDRWLLSHSKWTWELVQKTIRKQTVYVEQVPKAQGNYKLKSGDVVLVPKDLNLAEPVPVDSKLSKQFSQWIIAETETHILINKPSGIPAQGGDGIRTSVDVLAAHYCETARLMHRIDRETSGLLVISKTREGCGVKITEKQYLGIVSGYPTPTIGEIHSPIPSESKLKSASTAYEVLKTGKCAHDSFALMKFQLHTGRKHQIRIHAAEVLKCPIVGDLKYGYESNTLVSVPSMCLHSWRLRLSGVLFTAPLPEHFNHTLSLIPWRDLVPVALD